MHATNERIRVGIDDATEWAHAILRASGCTDDNADIVARHLVRSDQLGLASHGLSRVAQYVREIDGGSLAPAAVPSVSELSPTQVLVDGHGGFGPVACAHAVDAVADRAQVLGTGAASVRNVGHTGRVSAYTEPLAELGLVATAFATGRRRFHWMAPFGGTEGRMSTNPIAWSAPTSDGPLTADLAIASVPEGRIRLLRELGAAAPPDALLDAQGSPSLDPNDLYTDQRGTLLPLGGVHHGHKGYAIALLGETLSTLLAGDDTDDDDDRGNNLFLLAVRGDADLPERASRMAEYMRSSRPADPERPVLVPGERERTTADESALVGIGLELPVVDALIQLSERFGVRTPDDVEKA